MIFYFSATGNSKYVAMRIAQATREKAVSMTDCLHDNSLSFNIGENESIGFVTPTYFWGLPTVVVEFLDRVKLNMTGTHYAYHVLTFGTTTGQAHRMLEKKAARHGFKIDGKFNVRMVDSWTPLFDLSDSAKNMKITEAAEPAIAKAIEQITAKTVGDFDNGKIPEPFSALFYNTYRTGRKTKKFSVTDACTGCGACERGCHAKAIEMKDGKPAWVKAQCTLCLSCLHHCPSFAIRYGAASAKHGQFVNPNQLLYD